MKTAEIKGMEIGIQKGAVLSRQEDILENLVEIATVSDNVIKMINNQKDIDILKNG